MFTRQRIAHQKEANTADSRQTATTFVHSSQNNNNKQQNFGFPNNVASVTLTKIEQYE